VAIEERKIMEVLQINDSPKRPQTRVCPQIAQNNNSIPHDKQIKPRKGVKKLTPQ